MIEFQPPVISRGLLGLGNVNNTSDADKPVSVAQAAVIAVEAAARVAGDGNLQTQIANLAAGDIRIVGPGFDASSGAFPTSAQYAGATRAVQAGDTFRVSGAGTISGVSFVATDTITAIKNTPSASIYANNWQIGKQSAAINAADIRPFLTEAAMLAATDVVANQRAQVAGREWIYKALGAYTASPTVKNGAAFQLVSTSRYVDCRADEDTRTLALFQSVYGTVDTIRLRYNGQPVELQLTQVKAGNITNAAGVKMTVLSINGGYPIEVFGDATTSDVTAVFNKAQTAIPAGGTLIMAAAYNFAKGAAVTKAKLIIAGGGSIAATDTATFEGILQLSADGVKVKGMSFASDVSGITRIGVEPLTGKKQVVSGCDFTGFRYGILERAAVDRARYIRNSYDCGTYGQTFLAMSGNRGQAVQNIVTAFTDSGVVVTNSAIGAKVLNNEITARTSGTSTLGIAIEESASHCLVSGNLINGSWAVGGGLAGADVGCVNGIKVNDNLTGTCPRYITITDNIVRNVKNYGFVTINSGATRDIIGLQMSGNQAIDCGQEGYRLNDIASGSVLGNFASGCGRYGFLVSSANVNAEISHNEAINSGEYDYNIANFAGIFTNNRASGGALGTYFLNTPLSGLVFENNKGLGAGKRAGTSHVASFYGSLAAGTTTIFALDEVPPAGAIYIDSIAVYQDNVIAAVPANVKFQTNSTLSGVMSGTVDRNPAPFSLGVPIVHRTNVFADAKYVRFQVNNPDAAAHNVNAQVRYRVIGG